MAPSVLRSAPFAALPLPSDLFAALESVPGSSTVVPPLRLDIAVMVAAAAVIEEVVLVLVLVE